MVLEGVVGQAGDAGTQHLRPRPERWRSSRLPTSADDGLQLGVLDVLDQCLDQSGLADAGLAGDEEGAASAGCDVVEPGSKLGQLVAPAEEPASRPWCRPAGHLTSV